MRVLLHTPLKPPDHPVPSGDREMARGFRRLLWRLGHRVVVPDLSRVAPGVPAPDAHLSLERRARAGAERLIARWQALPGRHPDRFDLWFTYHCWYRKPDWLGPIVSRALGIPYVIAEASHASRRAYGPTRLGHRAVERALAAADLVVTVNPRDRPGVLARLRPGARQIVLPAFIEATPFVPARPRTGTEVPVLLAVGMMRTRDKLDSYRVFARALDHLKDRPWQAVLVGDGPARGEIETLMKPFGTKVRFVGAVEQRQGDELLAAAGGIHDRQGMRGREHRAGREGYDACFRCPVARFPRAARGRKGRVAVGPGDDAVVGGIDRMELEAQPVFRLPGRVVRGFERYLPVGVGRGDAHLLPHGPTTSRRSSGTTRCG